MQLGGTPVQLYDQAKDGVVDVVWTLPGNTAGRFPRIEVFELPFMMNNAEATSKAYWEYFSTVASGQGRRGWLWSPGVSLRPVEGFRNGAWCFGGWVSHS